AGILGPGAEWLLPFAFERAGDLFDYLAPESVVAIDDPLSFETALGREQTRIDAGAEFARMRRFLFPEAAEVFHTEASLRERLGAFRRLHFEAVSIQTAAQEGATLSLPCATHEELRSRLKDLKGDERHLQPLADRVAEWREAGARTLLVCHTDSQGERLRELLEDYGLYPARVDAGAWSPGHLAALPPLGLALGPLNDGFHLSNLGLAVVAEEEIFGHRVRPRKQRRARDFIASIGDIHAGDCVVHIDYGVGRYLGLARKAIGTEEADFLTLEYAGGDRVFVPVQKINLVQRYVGAEEGEPKLTKLGGTTWDKVKRKAKEAVEEMAEELIRLYAKRRTASRTAYGAPDHYFREFEASFAYEETPDQASAIDDVLADLQKDQPMDRLVCGDVGYGKTEVAIRAAFRVASEGKQVAVLVPTTVLCEQHYNTFKERVGPYALRVAEL
ncbi:MAG: DEAD/DEAH box helicase, partial [Candidatus Methylomirabilis sp.]|nr:DEAD/DEAH box helicase [Deltaproteobacteria bacterium]